MPAAPTRRFRPYRGGRFANGDCIHTDDANYNDNYEYSACGAKTGRNHGKPVPVGSYKPNRFGLHDMTGNVLEWTADCYQDSYAGVPVDGSAAPVTSGCKRVLRGGSWFNVSWDVRTANRGGGPPGDSNSGIGFRLTRTLP